MVLAFFGPRLRRMSSKIFRARSGSICMNGVQQLGQIESGGCSVLRGDDAVSLWRRRGRAIGVFLDFPFCLGTFGIPALYQPMRRLVEVAISGTAGRYRSSPNPRYFVRRALTVLFVVA